MKHVKHLIECQCTLKIFENKTKPIYHKFPVFSLLDDNEEVEEKYVLCDNCDIVHKVYDYCKSEILWGKEGFKSLVTSKEDIKFNLESQGKEKIIEILETNLNPISDWEYVEYLLENNEEGFVVLSKEDIKDNTVYKCLYIKGDNFKIKKETSQRFI